MLFPGTAWHTAQFSLYTRTPVKALADANKAQIIPDFDSIVACNSLPRTLDLAHLRARQKTAQISYRDTEGRDIDKERFPGIIDYRLKQEHIEAQLKKFWEHRTDSTS